MNRRTHSRLLFAEYRRAAAARRLGASDAEPAGAEESRSRHRSTRELARVFWSMLGRHRGATVFSLSLLTLSVALGLAPLYLPKVVIDSVLDDKPLPLFLRPVLPTGGYPLLITLVSLFVVLLAISEIIGLWARWHAARVSRRLQADVRRKSFEHACQLPMHRVADLKSGGVSSILRDDAGAVGDLVTRGLYHPWRALVQLVGSLVILMWIDWRLLLVGVFVIPAGWITHLVWVRCIRPLWRDVRRTRLEVDSVATEVFGGIRIVRAFGRRRAETAAFVRRLNLMLRQELYAWWWMRGVETLWSIAIPVGTGILLFLGSWRILSDREAVAAGALLPDEAFTTGALIAFLTYLAAMLRPISTLAATATQLQNALAGLDRTLDLLDEPIETPPAARPGRLRRSEVRGEVRLESVSFTYPRSEQAAVSDIDLGAAPGSLTALVGASGSGKTTLCNLIARFYQPTAGRILLDGADTRGLDLDDYRRLLGIVEQDIFLFDGTIAENIAYSRRSFSRADIRGAARLANAHDFVSAFPDGYDTMIGERGLRLSGGQRQRLAIARAVLADPRILILDEATSALDTESERLIQESLTDLMRDRTCFVIAHRLSTIVHADQIVVMEAGRVVEQGTHGELLKMSSQYRRMIELQIMDAGPLGGPGPLRRARAAGLEHLEREEVRQP